LKETSNLFRSFVNLFVTMCPSLFSQTLFRRKGEGWLTFPIRKSFGILGFLLKKD